MTTIRITNDLTIFSPSILPQQANKFYIELPNVKITEGLIKKQENINLAKQSDEWGNGPERLSIDFLDIDRKITINGLIDLECDNNASWVQFPVADAAIVKERLIYMMEHGGVVGLYLGLDDDGYTNDPVLNAAGDGDRLFSVSIISMSFVEIPRDDSVATVYDFTIEVNLSNNL